MCTTIPTNQDEKLGEVLRLLMLPDYAIASTAYFDILLSHIAKNVSSGCKMIVDFYYLCILQENHSHLVLPIHNKRSNLHACVLY